MGQYTDLEIEKVFKGNSGEGQYGPYQYYDVYFKKGDTSAPQKFSWSQSGKKIVPEIGMKISFMAFDTKPWAKDGKSGKNYNITELVLADDQEPSKSSPEAQNGTQNQQQGKQAYIDHGKCVIELMKTYGANPDILKEMIYVFLGGIAQMTGNEEKHKDLSEPIRDDEPPPPEDDSDIPF